MALLVPGGTGGSACWVWAVLSHDLHAARLAAMSAAMLGQKSDLSALLLMVDVPWCPECSVSRTRCLRFPGTTSRLPWWSTRVLLDHSSLFSRVAAPAAGLSSRLGRDPEP